MRRFGRIVFICVWLAMMYLIASNIQAGWLYVVIALFLMVVAISVLYPVVLVRGVKVSSELPRYAERDAVTSASVTVVNMSKRRRTMIRIQPQGRGFRLEPEALFFAVLEPGAELNVPVRFVCEERGMRGPGSFLVSCGAPLGIFIAEKRIACSAQTTVYPRLLRMESRDLLREYGLHDPGLVQRAMGAQDPYHYTLREYRPGDSLCDIHWKLTARTNAPVVRVRERKIVGRAWVQVENMQSRYPDDGGQAFEEALERGLAAVRGLLFDFGYTVTVSGTAAPAITVNSEAEWERVLSWFSLVPLEQFVPEPKYGARNAAGSADISLTFGVETKTRRGRDIE